MTKKKDQNVDIIIVGAGPAGLTTAILLGRAGFRVAVLDRAALSTRADNRTAALLRPSVDVLHAAGVDPLALKGTAPLERLALMDQGPPPTRHDFAAVEIGEDYFALNIFNAELVKALTAQARREPNLTLMAPWVPERLQVTDAAVTLTGLSGCLTARLVMGADGKQSWVRDQAGIATRIHDYAQTALTGVVHHTRDHDNTSYEWHRPGGPLTFVPQAGRTSSVVWMNTSARAQELMAMSLAARTKALQAESGDILGRLTLDPDWQAWPIMWQMAEALTAPRVALMAEAAHALPPSGAQGLNLSLQDAAVMADILGRARRLGLDPGSRAVLDDYARARGAAVLGRARAVDGLNRLILSDRSWVQQARRAGLHLAATTPPLRRLAMQMGWVG